MAGLNGSVLRVANTGPVEICLSAVLARNAQLNGFS